MQLFSVAGNSTGYAGGGDAKRRPSMEEQPRVRVTEPVLCFTSDVDWASDPCLEDLFGQLASRGIRPTVFATHRSEVLATREAAGDVEVGIHPNFLPGSTHGAGEDEVIDHVLGLFPSARAFRSHCFVDSTHIVRRMLARGIRYDSNLCLFLEPELRPLRHGGGIVRLPVFWEDDCHWELTGGDWDLASYLGRFLTPGLKILNVHPFPFAVNVPDAGRYGQIKHHIPTLSEHELPALVHPGAGSRTFVLDLLDSLLERGLRFHTLHELYETYGTGVGTKD
jgi:hypothetical protein